MKNLSNLAKQPLIGPIVQKAMSTLASHKAKQITEHFSVYLRPTVANSPELRTAVYRLRHSVYCEELRFEEEKPDAIERDEFDARSIHCFVRHLASQALAGTVRLITSPDRASPLPIEKFCREAISDPVLNPWSFPPELVCEISRLAVPANFRKRQIDKYEGSASGVINEATFSFDELRCFPYIAISLYLSAAVMSLKTGRVHGFVMMEPRLARSLTLVGIHFKPIGQTIDYHGLRAPYYIDARQIRPQLSSGFQRLMDSIEYELLKDINLSGNFEQQFFQQCGSDEAASLMPGVRAAGDN